MTTSYYADRANLFRLERLHPSWTHQQLADALGHSRDWVKKWPPSTRPARPTRGWSSASWPSAMSRPKACTAHPDQKPFWTSLARDAQLQAAGVPLPHSSRTIYRILKKRGRIPQPRPRRHEPPERNTPMTAWQADFKDVSSVPADPQGKQQHVVETRNIVDSGTSILLDAQVRQDFTAEVALEALVIPL